MSTAVNGGRQPPAGAVTWGALLAETRRALRDDAAARWICEVASGADSMAEVLDELATERAVAHLDAMTARYRRGEPLAYVLGRWSFRHLDLAVDGRVLIPRPETEVVAGVAIELGRLLRSTTGDRLTIVDLGTGSGAIGLALADELPLGSAEIWLTDASADALDVARANLAGVGRAAAHVRIAEPGEWFAPLPEDLQFDLVVSNPPYIADGSALVDDAVRAWEPHSALFAGPDGLDDIGLIARDARERLREGGWLVLEIGADQGSAVAELLRSAGYADVAIRPDLAGRDRIATARSGS